VLLAGDEEAGHGAGHPAVDGHAAIGIGTTDGLGVRATVGTSVRGSAAASRPPTAARAASHVGVALTSVGGPAPAGAAPARAAAAARPAAAPGAPRALAAAATGHHRQPQDHGQLKGANVLFHYKLPHPSSGVIS